MIYVSLVAAIALTACSRAPQPSGSSQPAEAPSQNLASPLEMKPVDTQWMPGEGPKVLLRANFPTAIAISPAFELFYTERTGRLFKVDLAARPGGSPPKYEGTLIHQIPVSTRGERGLLGLALHPEFANRRWIYLFASPADTDQVSRIHRLELEGDTVREDKVIIELPAGEGCCHKGGRLSFGPDGKLYVTLGDALAPTASRDPNDLRGKILRFEPDGSVPGDGPFGPDNPVWATGLRNSFGLTFGPNGEAYATDNGPSGGDVPPCCDELNRVSAGEFYGWPGSFGPRYYRGVRPIWHSGDGVVVPTGVVVVSSKRFAALEGAVAFCSFAENRMFVVDREGQLWVQGLPEPGRGPDGCGLDVLQGPDDRLYFSDKEAIYVWG